MANIFFDLDGTLLDSKVRVFELFKHLTNNTTIDSCQYWNLKKAMFSNEWILKNKLNYNSKQIDTFFAKWMKLIEAKEFLDIDKPFNYTRKTLEIVKKLNYNIWIISARQYKLKAIQQINAFKLDEYLKGVLITKQNESKYSCVKNKCIKITPDDYFVGDTGIDIEAGKRLVIKTVAVLSGFRSENILKKYKPDFIFKNALDFVLTILVK